MLSHLDLYLFNLLSTDYLLGSSLRTKTISNPKVLEKVKELDTWVLTAAPPLVS